MQSRENDERVCREQVLADLLGRLPCEHRWQSVSMGRLMPSGSRAMVAARACVACGTLVLTGVYSEQGAGTGSAMPDVFDAAP